MKELFFKLILLVFALFMVVLVLLQRGKGGGLAGALGGMGGQSAFGAKAGDKTMRFTSYMAIVWILFCALAVVALKPASILNTTGPSTTPGGDGSTPPSESGDGAGGAPTGDAPTGDAPAGNAGGTTPEAPASGS